jgi:hypothetical protein
MLQYDLTQTRLFHDPNVVPLPDEAELFGITAALLLLNNVSYAELVGHDVALTDANVDAVATCLDERLPQLARDLQVRGALRKRLTDLVGIRIRNV